MKTHVVNIAKIFNGHPFPQRIERSARGSVAVLQMKDLTSSLQLESVSPIHVTATEIKKRYLIQCDDIVFRSRGQTNTAIILKTDLGLAVVAAPLLVLRVTTDAVLPDFLCWWINQPAAQIHFDRHASGTSVRMISPKALATLEVPIVPMEKQRHIVDLALLGEREQELLSRLAAAEKNKLNGILIRTATE